MIEVRNLTKYFNGHPAVKELSFSVKEGETLILLGTSGCGKTTTLKMINRLIDSDKGEISIHNKSIKTTPPEKLRRKMGYVLQNHGLFPHYTIRENISVVPQLLKWNKEKVEHRANTLLEKFNLPPHQYLEAYPDQLSGGQRQRVGFVRALMANPPVILMDEPLGALDPITRNQIQKEFKQLDELSGKTILMVTHDISEAIALGDRICLMNQGELQQIGTASELLLHPGNNFVRNFFSGDQLIYQMKALKLKDLLSYFSRTTPREKDKIISAHYNVMATLERLSNADNTHKNFLIKENSSDHFFSVDLHALLSAFNKKIRSYS